jgi:hypothetical protein
MEETFTTEMILDGQRFIKMTVSCYNNWYRIVVAHFISFLLFCWHKKNEIEERSFDRILEKKIGLTKSRRRTP